MRHSGFGRAALHLVLLCGIASSKRLSAEDVYSSEGKCDDQHICVVSANAPGVHEEGLPSLMQACLQNEPSTEIIAFALQDYPGGDFPHYVKHLEGLPAGARFKLRHQVTLSDTAGKGHFCHSYFAGGLLAGAAIGGAVGLKLGLLAHFGGPLIGFTVHALTTVVGAVGGAVTAHAASSALGANCGGVAVVVYSVRKVTVDFDSSDPEALRTISAGKTVTTHKGSVVAKFNINGRSLVLASTHGTEGVRAKSRKASCPQDVDQKDVEREQQRVRDFSETLELINEVRGGDKEPPGVVWGGDFNPRTVEPNGPKAGCPMWPDEFGFDLGTTSGAKAALEKLQQGREILGSDTNGDLVTFSALLTDEGLEEAPGLACPTYKKQKKKEKKPKTEKDASAELEAASQFWCAENVPDAGAEIEEANKMHYKISHPPSWTDRFFTSADSTAWLTCSPARRISHLSDHDAVLVTCAIQPGEDCDQSNAESDQEKVAASRCCCKGDDHDQCKLMEADELNQSKNWFKRGTLVCPGDEGWHHSQRFHAQLPEACVDQLDGVATLEKGT